jgi:hypothetical protein
MTEASRSVGRGAGAASTANSAMLTPRAHLLIIGVACLRAGDKIRPLAGNHLQALVTPIALEMPRERRHHGPPVPPQLPKHTISRVRTQCTSSQTWHQYHAAPRLHTKKPRLRPVLPVRHTRRTHHSRHTPHPYRRRSRQRASLISGNSLQEHPCPGVIFRAPRQGEP